MTQFTCKGVKQINNRISLNTFTIRISLRFLSALEFQIGNFQKYWSQNVGQDFLVLYFFVGGRSCGRKRCVREINVSRAGDPVHEGDKALKRDTPVQSVCCYTWWKKTLKLLDEIIWACSTFKIVCWYSPLPPSMMTATTKIYIS